ncbi:MAG TPA: hypothetical protein VIJ00_11715 [Nakamurella sp.]
MTVPIAVAASRYLAAWRCPPREAIADRRSRIAADNAARFGDQPRRSHSRSQSSGAV